jgi:hypothetical protein
LKPPDLLDPMSSIDRRMLADWFLDHNQPEAADTQQEIADAIDNGITLPKNVEDMLRAALLDYGPTIPARGDIVAVVAVEYTVNRPDCDPNDLITVTWSRLGTRSSPVTYEEIEYCNNSTPFAIRPGLLASVGQYMLTGCEAENYFVAVVVHPDDVPDLLSLELV